MSRDLKKSRGPAGECPHTLLEQIAGFLSRDYQYVCQICGFSGPKKGSAEEAMAAFREAAAAKEEKR